ncbi:MAG: hypothetical protein WC917_02425 [Bacilli bacterium]
MITKVIDDQKIDIDTVSGATINDKILLKSIYYIKCVINQIMI